MASPVGTSAHPATLRPRGRSGRSAWLLERLLASWPDDRERIRRLCAADVDWRALLAEAERHGVLGILHQPLLAIAPAAVQARLEDRRACERLWQSRLQDALRDSLDALETAGVRTVALKGPVLADRLYGDPSARPANDLDLLIAAADLGRATAVLETRGYRAESGPAARYQERYHHHIHFDAPLRPTIELHFRLFTGFGVQLAAEEFLSRAVSYRASWGPRCWILAPEDELFYLAVHAAGHELGRLAWLYDLKALLRCRPALDCSLVRARARAAGVARAVDFALDGLERRLGVAPDPAGAERPRTRAEAGAARRPEGRARGLHLSRALLVAAGMLPAGSHAGKLCQLLFAASLCDSVPAALWHLQHHLWRVSRRRLQQSLPRLVPPDWAG